MFKLSQMSRIAQLVIAAVVGGGIFAAFGAAPPEQPAAAPRSDQIAKQRLEVARQAYRDLLERQKAGFASASDAAEWLRRQMQAELDLGQPKAQRIAALERYVALFRQLEAQARRSGDAGVASPSDMYLAVYNRLDAELLLAREREAAGNNPPAAP